MTGRVTTFYSYKGGVGRTFLMANVSWLLARWGRRVLCLDWDLEAPGLHRYLAPLAPRRSGVIDLVEAIASDVEPEWREWVETVRGPWNEGGCLHLMAAGRGDDDYVARVQKLDWERMSEGGFEARLEDVRSEWVDAYDHILIDSRTGITDAGGICAAQLPDVLVLTLTATYQSLEGAIEVARRASEARSAMPLDRGGFDVLPVPSRVHAGEEDLLEQEWNERFEAKLAHLFAPWKAKEVEVREYITQLRVIEQARWSFGEQLPVRTEPLDEPIRVSYAFANVAALIDVRLDDAGDIAHDRHARLSALAGSAGLAAPEPAERAGPDVYLSFPLDRWGDARLLAHGLRERGLSVFHQSDLPLGTDWVEATYSARSTAAAFVILVGCYREFNDVINVVMRVPFDDQQHDESKHIERLTQETSPIVIPLFTDGEAFKVAPRFLRSRVGIFLEQVESMESVAASLAKSLETMLRR